MIGNKMIYVDDEGYFKTSGYEEFYIKKEAKKIFFKARLDKGCLYSKEFDFSSLKYGTLVYPENFIPFMICGFRPR